MKHFSACIFDMDGLLIDSERLALETFRSTCDQFGTGDLTSLFNRLLGTNLQLEKKILKEELEGVIDHIAFGNAWSEKYIRATSEKPVPLRKGVLDVLEYLQSNNIPRAVATSTATERATEKLQKSGIWDYFNLIVGGEQVAESKPAPDIFLKAALKLSVAPARCLAFEDSNNGVRAAAAAGMTVVQIPDLIQPDEAIRKLGPIVLACISDILSYDFSEFDK